MTNAMACRSAQCVGMLLRRSRITKAALIPQNTTFEIVSRVKDLNMSPLQSACCTTKSFASFHTSSMKMNEHIVTIQDEDDFKAKVLTSPKPVIVDFFATWCGPCKLLVPRLEALAAVKKGSVLLAKIDIDELSDLAGNYGVEAVPTVLAIKDGKVTDKFVGLKDDAALESFVNKLTAGSVQQ